jgi:hypothetical protein
MALRINTMNDLEIRAFVYDVTMRTGRPPLVAELDAPEDEVIESLKRIAAARALVMQRDRDELLMVPPFSAVATPFVVRSGGVSYYANCMWDALGVPAMLHQDAEISASCGDCGTAMDVTVESGVTHGEHDAGAGVAARRHVVRTRSASAGVAEKNGRRGRAGVRRDRIDLAVLEPALSYFWYDITSATKSSPFFSMPSPSL